MRRQLQDRAKALGIKANSKTDILVQELRNAGELDWLVEIGVVPAEAADLPSAEDAATRPR